MDSAPVDQVKLTLMGWADGQINNWQGMVRDGRRITGISLAIAIDDKGQRTFEATVDYAEPPTA